MEIDGDVLDQCVLFISTTESRNKIYRLIQYSAKRAKWAVMRSSKLTQDDLRVGSSPPLVDVSFDQARAHVPSSSTPGTAMFVVPSATQKLDINTINKPKERARWLAVTLARVESLFGDARKVYRLFQFLEMMDLFRHVNDPDPSVRALRRLRVLCFFFFYLLENYMVYLLRIKGFPHRHPRVVLLKRSCNGFWCVSILLAFVLDRITKRGGALATLKKALDLPVAYLAFSDRRVSDGFFAMLGIASAEIGVYLRWVEVMAKMRQKRLLQGKLLVDIA